jgi:hypothetical protein
MILSGTGIFPLAGSGRYYAFSAYDISGYRRDPGLRRQAIGFSDQPVTWNSSLETCSWHFAFAT